MAKIKIMDLPENKKISAAELRRIFGGAIVTQGPLLQGKLLQGKLYQGRLLQSSPIPGCVSVVWFHQD